MCVCCCCTVDAECRQCSVEASIRRLDVFRQRVFSRQPSLFTSTADNLRRDSEAQSSRQNVAATSVSVTLLLKFIRPFYYVWLNGLVVSALGIRARGPGFDSRVVPLFHWIATLGKLFPHIASPVSQLQETGVQKEVFVA